MALIPALPGGRRRRHGAVLALVLGLGTVLFLLQLGSTGLVDETPPLFAAAARAMAESGDWLIPRVNGLPRYDKPPLVYWLMALGYALPGQARWNPLGTWAAHLPSALAAIAVMLLLADTLLRWPQAPAGAGSRAATIQALTASLAFGLSPLALVWGRTAVSDALFTALVATSLLAAWRAYAAVRPGPWWPCWLALGMAVLAKGPVAVVLLGLSLALFVLLQRDRRWRLARLHQRLRPWRGLALTALVALPWYGLALMREGEPFWRSFFGYHNLQRFQQVVNNHQQPAWYFAALLLMAALPFTPLLLLALARTLALGRHDSTDCVGTASRQPPQSLAFFSACWLLAVLLFFTLAATKLPSYWLPATPAAALLVALALPQAPGRLGRAALMASGLLLAALSATLAAAPHWLAWIEEPAIPSLAAELAAGPWFRRGALLTALAAAAGVGMAWTRGGSAEGRGASLMVMQGLLVALVPLLLLPLAQVGDRLRGAPLRQLADALQCQGLPGEPLAMVGLMKPSLHYYSRRLVLYEGRSPRAMLNLVDRLSHERRPGFSSRPGAANPAATVLVVIDQRTLAASHWQGLSAVPVAEAGVYRLLRMERARLESRASALRREGLRPNWRQPRPERW